MRANAWRKKVMQKNIYEKLIELGLDKKDILLDEPMKNHTSFRVGGPAEVFLTCKNEEVLSKVLSFLSNDKVKHLLIGNGSNLLFTDNGYKGVIVKLAGDFEAIEKIGKSEIKAGSAALLSKVGAFALTNSLAGMEFASGIPGSLGGATFMNAGAYGGEMKDIIKEVRVMKKDGSEIYIRTADNLDLSYRHSALQDDEEIVLSVNMELTCDDEVSIKARMDELAEKRRTKQPVNLPSAGSFFKRPVGGYAAALIEEAGLKGYSVGGASVSSKHSGFVVNDGGATFSDIMKLMKHVQKTVNEKFGIMLEPEVRIIE